MFFRKKQDVYHRVHTYGSPILNKKAESVKNINEEINAIATEMIETMLCFDGIGLAGPQAGVGRRIVAFGIPEHRDDEEQAILSPGEALLLPKMPFVIVNPEITWRSDETEIKEEGCLSLPGIYGEVERPKMVTFTAETLDGKTISCDCDGLLARCVQHECDHLDGKLFIERMTEEEFGIIKPKLNRLKKRGRKTQFMRIVGGE
ncbi:MAG: peptide deformylase [Victivallaceae bacterium]|nr:peptide deformylase [Victivallaceae bacterium]